MNTKNELLKFYEKIADGVQIRSKCDWHQYGEKSTKFFLNLEKKRAISGTVKKLLNCNTETSNTTENNYHSNIYERIP